MKEKKTMKPNKNQIAALKAAGVRVSGDTEYTTITYFTHHGGEEIIEVPHGEDMSQFLCDAYEDYDPSYETYLWLDDTGHGKHGAPYEMQDILDDKKEWERKLDELSIIAAKFHKRRGIHK